VEFILQSKCVPNAENSIKLERQKTCNILSAFWIEDFSSTRESFPAGRNLGWVIGIFLERLFGGEDSGVSQGI
jgi:hypothetical protein